MFGWHHGKGAIVVDGRHVADTLQCVHCGNHWETKPGSGTERGFCTNCSGPVCGAHACFDCKPHEAQIELQEKIWR